MRRLILLLLIALLSLQGVFAQESWFLPSDAPVIAAENAAALERIETLGRGWIGGLSWTADGEAVMAAGLTGVWRYAPGEAEPDAPLYPFAGTTVSSTGRYVLDRQDDVLSVLDLEADRTFTLPNPRGRIIEIAFSPDDTRMAALDPGSGETALYSLPSGEAITTLALDIGSPSRDTLSISPDNRLIAAAEFIMREPREPNKSTYVDQIHVWDIETGEKVATLSSDGEDQLITFVVFSPDSRRLAVSHIGGITLYDIESGEAQRLSLPLWDEDRGYGDQRALDRVVFTDEGARVVGAWNDLSPDRAMYAALTAWDVESGEIVAQVDNMRGFMLGLDASPDGTQVAVYSYDGHLHIWDMEGEATSIAGDHPAGAEVLAVNPEGSILAVGGFDRAVRLWSLETGELTETLFRNNRDTSAVVYNEAGILASGSFIDTWTYENGEVRDIDFAVANVYALSFAGNRLTALSGLDSSLARIATTDITTDAIEQYDLTASATVGALTATGHRAAVYNSTEGIILFDLVPEQDEIGRFPLEEVVSVLAFQPDTDVLFAGSDRWLTAYEYENAGYEVEWKVEHDGGVTALAFSPDGALVVSGNETGTLALWDALSGQAITTLPVSATQVYGLTFSPDGRMLFVATDTTVQVWAVS